MTKSSEDDLSWHPALSERQRAAIRAGKAKAYLYLGALIIISTEEGPDKMSFIKELKEIINRYSKENGSDTPDHILAEYLNGCLDIFNVTVSERERWYGRVPKTIAAKESKE